MADPSIRCSWTVCGGSLSGSVTVEDSSTITDPNSKTPLVLLRPGSSPPCEITLNFGQKREVQQVYLRSTARIFEVYYSSSSSPDYLCTVRCCPLSPEDSHNFNLAPSLPCEDDWVDVNLARSFPDIKDFYQATAQISDADPCISITIRLLSIQSGDHVYVDELCVFAEPMDSSPVVRDDRTESAAGNPLMSMLVPTLLQLSRSGLANQVQGALAGDRKDGPGFPISVCDETLPAFRPKFSPLPDTPQPKLSDVHSSAAPGTPCERLADQGSDTSCRCSDTLLKDLLPRVAGIEQICLRFDENMLRTLGHIEARLARVEAQLQAMNQKSTGAHDCDNIFPPDCFPRELSFNAFSNGNRAELHLDDDSSIMPSSQPDKTSDSADSGIYRDSVLPLNSSDGEINREADSPPLNEDESPNEKTNQVSLSLSSSDDGDDYETSAPKKDDEPSIENTKQAPSIDEALVFALAGFVSSIHGCPVEDTSCVAVKALEFSPKDNEPHEGKRSVPSECNDISAFSTYWTDRSEYTKDSHTSAQLPHDEVGSDDYPSDKYVEKAGAERNELPGPSVQAPFDDYWRIEEAEQGETIAEKRSVFSCDDDVPLQESHLMQAIGSLSFGEEATVQQSKVLHGKNEKIMGAIGDVLDGILTFSRDAGVVDFESPILDVKFKSEERSYVECSLECLWSNMHEETESPPREGKSNDLYLDMVQENLIVVDDGKAVACSTNSIDHRYCGLLDMPDKEDVKASYQAGSNDDILAGSLI